MSRTLPVAALLVSLALGVEARAGDPPAVDAKSSKSSKSATAAKAKKEKGKAKAASPPAAIEPTAAELAEEGVSAAEPVDDAAENPELAAMLAELDPDTRAKVDALGPDGFALLLEKLGTDAPRSDDEAQIEKGFQQAFIRTFERELAYQRGDVSIADGLATLHLGDELRFLGAADAQKVLVDAWGNPPDSSTLGMIVPADTSPLDPATGWGVVLTFSEDGYVEDDDAEDIDYDELLVDMKKATEEANPGRIRQGYGALHLVGWAEPPHYDAATHRLYWAQELASDDGTSLNYAIRVLGRRGVLELNAVAPMPMLEQVRPAMEQVMAQVEFESGHRYEDFDPDIDTVAAYGIGGLIAGKVLLKTGLLAGLATFFLAAKKFVIVGVIALGAAVKAWFSRRKAE